MRSPSSNAWHSEAAANGVTLGLEVVNRYETNLAVEHPRRVAYLRKRLTTNTVSTATRAIRVYPGIYATYCHEHGHYADLRVMPMSSWKRLYAQGIVLRRST